MTLFYKSQILLFRKFCNMRDWKAEGKGAKGIEENGGEFTAGDGCNGTTEAVEGASENLDLVVGTGKGVGVFDRTVGEIEDVTETLDLPVGHPGKSSVAIGSGRGRRVHDVAREQEALFEDILAVTLVNTDENLASDDNPFLDMTCPISP